MLTSVLTLKNERFYASASTIRKFIKPQNGDDSDKPQNVIYGLKPQNGDDLAFIYERFIALNKLFYVRTA